MLVLLLASQALAGIWVRAPGESYVQIAVSHSEASTSFDPSGARLDLAHRRFLGERLSSVFADGHFASTELGAYVEYGLIAHVEVFGSLPVRVASSRWQWALGDNPDVVLGNVGLGDAQLGLRSGTTVGPVALSIAAAGRAPLYNNAPDALNQGPGNSDFYDDRIPLGEGTIDLDLTGGVGVSFGEGWAQVETGVRLRNRQYSTMLPGRAQLGLQPIRAFGLTLDGEWLVTLHDGAAPDFYIDRWGKSPTILDGQQHVKVGGGVFVRPLGRARDEALRELGLGLRGATMPWGRRTAAATSLTLAVFWQGEMPW